MLLSKQLKSEVSYHTFRFTASRMPPGSNRTASWAARSLYRLLPVTDTPPSRRTRSGNPDTGKSPRESAQCTDMYTCSSLAFPHLPLLLFWCTWTLSLLIFFLFFFLLGGKGIGQYVYQKFHSSIIFALWHYIVSARRFWHGSNCHMLILQCPTTLKSLTDQNLWFLTKKCEVLKYLSWWELDEPNSESSHFDLLETHSKGCPDQIPQMYGYKWRGLGAPLLFEAHLFSSSPFHPQSKTQG